MWAVAGSASERLSSAFDLGRLVRRFYPFRPRVKSRHFWVVQSLVLIIEALHSAVENFQLLQHDHSLSFVPAALFLIPVVYAALNFGLAGSVATALWCNLLAVPNVFVFHVGLERTAEFVQIGVVDAIAVFVGQRVDRESSARHRAEEIGAALRVSETKYRRLFASSPVPVLVLDMTGVVLEANPAAGALFGDRPTALQGRPLAGLFGAAYADKVLEAASAGQGHTDLLILRQSDSRAVYLMPTLTKTSDERGSPLLQVILNDVTVEHYREAGLRAYAAQIIRAQEQERQRIAQELHDETVQRLVLLCLQLDMVEGANGNLPGQALSDLREARGSAAKVLAELRGFARALRPSTLDDLGLVTAIRRLVVDLSDRTKIEGRLNVVGDERRLDPDAALALFRIAQEGLRNVERHAKATHLGVTIDFAVDRVTLSVCDDGIGFRPPSGLDFAASGQLGLLGIRERVEALGGDLKIDSQVGRGSTLTATVPNMVSL